MLARLFALSEFTQTMDTLHPPTMSHTLRNERRDFPEWHKGRSHYALWALDLDTAPVQQRMLAAQQHLAPWLLQGYRRQPHITVGLCGFLGATAQEDDDFDPGQLHAHLAALRASGPGRFHVGIGGLASFSSVPYLTVGDASHGLDRLRHCVAQNAMNTTHGGYTPHVTVGLYADAWPMAEVQASLERFAPGPALPVEVTALWLLCYEARDIGGPLTPLARFDLDSGALQWQHGQAHLVDAYRS